jgi:hypothetical protein
LDGGNAKERFMKRRRLVLPAYLALAACGGGTEQATNSPEQLDEAAAQSDPAAAQAIEDAAANGASPQEALAAGGAAQANTVAGQQSPNMGAGAKPHSPGDPVPPPKTRSTPQLGGTQPGGSATGATGGGTGPGPGPGVGAGNSQ